MYLLKPCRRSYLSAIRSGICPITSARRPEELIAKAQELLPQKFDERGWMGHLVVVPDDHMHGQRWIVDPSFEQVIHGLNSAGAEIIWLPMVELISLGERFDRKHPQRHVIDLPKGKLLVEYTATKDSSSRNDKS